jgi:hypothetical protein
VRSWVKPVLPEVDEVVEFDPPELTVEVAENPVVNVLYGPDGEPVSFLLEREPIGYRLRGDR